MKLDLIFASNDWNECSLYRRIISSSFIVVKLSSHEWDFNRLNQIEIFQKISFIFFKFVKRALKCFISLCLEPLIYEISKKCTLYALLIRWSHFDSETQNLNALLVSICIVFLAI